MGYRHRDHRNPAGAAGVPVGLDRRRGREGPDGARWYDPAAGDFTSRDTVTVSPDPNPVAGNPFAYAGDQPLDLIDPTGHMFIAGELGTRSDATRTPAMVKVHAAIGAAQLANANKVAAAREAAARAAARRAQQQAARRKATVSLNPKDRPPGTAARAQMQREDATPKLCQKLATNCQPCQSADPNECYHTRYILDPNYRASTGKPSDSESLSCTFAPAGPFAFSGCSINAASGEKDGSAGASGTRSNGDGSSTPPVRTPSGILNKGIAAARAKQAALGGAADATPLVSGKPDDAYFETQDEALAAALQAHDVSDASTVQVRTMYGKNPNLIGPNGEPWYELDALDNNDNIVTIANHANGHYFADNNTYALPHYHGPDGSHYFYGQRIW